MDLRRDDTGQDTGTYAWFRNNEGDRFPTAMEMSRHVEKCAGITNLEWSKATILEVDSSSGGNLRPISTPRARISSDSMTTNSDVGVCRIQVDYVSYL